METLIDRIDASLHAGCESESRADLLGEKACYLARSGSLVQAELVIQQMRTLWGDGSSARAMVWIMLAEGLIFYYSRHGDEAWDRIRRASLIAKMSGTPRLLPLTLAWLGHVEFFRSNYESMAHLINESRASAGSDSEDVRLRNAITMADASLYAGQVEESQTYFETAHMLAVQSLDRVAIGSLIYNRSIFGISRVLSDSILHNNLVDETLLRRYELELGSAEAYDNLSGVVAFSEQIEIFRCRARLASGDFKFARSLLSRIESNLTATRIERAFGRYVGDRALCLAGVGEIDKSYGLIMEFLSMKWSDLDVDEKLLETSFALTAAKLLGIDELCSTLEEALSVARIAFLKEMERVQSALMTASTTG